MTDHKLRVEDQVKLTTYCNMDLTASYEHIETIPQRLYNFKGPDLLLEEDGQFQGHEAVYRNSSSSSYHVNNLN